MRLDGQAVKKKTSHYEPRMEMFEVAAHTKHTYLSAHSRRLAARCSKKKAMVAIGHSVLVIIYHVLSGKKS